MQRILIVGSCGAGKTYLALQLSKAISLPVLHLDSLYWRENWKEIGIEEKKNITEQIISRQKWIIDGNYASTFEMRLAAADTVIILYTNRWICLLNIIKRRLLYFGKERPEFEGRGCYERMNFKLLLYVFKYPKLHLPKIVNLLKKHDDKAVYVLTNRKEISNFLDNI